MGTFVQDLFYSDETMIHKHPTQRRRLPCASSNQSLPVVAAAVDVDVSRDAVAAVAGEALLTLALLGRRLVSLHR